MRASTIFVSTLAAAMLLLASCTQEQQNKLGRDMLLKLKVYKGTSHPHSAQQPKALSI